VRPKVIERANEPGGVGVSIPLLLVLWAVCALIAGAVWQGIATSAPGAQAPAFGALLALGLGFGFAGAGLICVAIDIVRHP
jgi:hypothetical protein